ncbi:trimeric intracellular cation channel family protein [Cumulibacter soli]|uniref:trimeric intracellular cation channel family protein n=1 Tax=Cumulibacter soli TaxID=2546344 RepID=UPI001068C2A3|nr:trimeric intracellular cation channel family protein [Cumulibacter soli]
MTLAELNEVTRWLDLAGVFACAILGGAVARRVGLDLVGYLVVGIASGLGGGMIRDVLLQAGPPVALTDYAYLPTACAGALIPFIAHFSEDAWNRVFAALDATVIGLWAVTGAQKALAADLNWMAAVLLGVITAVGGGAVRDLMLRRIPAILGGNGLYASVAALSALILVVSVYLHAPVIGIIAGITVSLVVRMASIRFGWGLPTGLDWQPRSGLAKVWRRRTPWLRRPRRRRTDQGADPDQSADN